MYTVSVCLLKKCNCNYADIIDIFIAHAYNTAICRN